MNQVTLSRRNLLSLLAKLEIPGSQCSILKGPGTIVTAVPDEIYYVNRPEGPGPMTPETEEFVRHFEEALTILRARREQVAGRLVRDG
jgi:hypothetical protein